MSKRKYTGINIQYPISQAIVEGKKTIETRTYPIPAHLVNQELLIIETPGKEGKFTARIIGSVVFGESFQYKTADAFYADTPKHLVTPDSVWAFSSKKPKFGWTVSQVRAFKKPLPAPKKKGIKFTKNIQI